MSLSQRVGNLLGVIVPFAGAIVALAFAWQRLVGVRELALLAILYVLSALGTSVGFHRLLTHRSFETYRAVKYVLAILGTLSVQGSVVRWVASHRKHHAHADSEGDPHSPHVEGGGFFAGLMGLWHAHMGWLLTRGHGADPARYARELLEDRGMRVIGRAFPLIVLAGLIVPFTIGLGLGGTVEAGLAALVCGGFARIFLWHHVTFSINSLCHVFGSRQFETRDRSTNLFWLALPSMGEAWHNNHHAFPRSARHGLRWWQLDPSAVVIHAMASVGLAWNVIEITPERQRQKALATPS
jgi:stearoyl-CoA desaturase (Delta-9 desaturase)